MIYAKPKLVYRRGYRMDDSYKICGDTFLCSKVDLRVNVLLEFFSDTEKSLLRAVTKCSNIFLFTAGSLSNLH